MNYLLLAFSTILVSNVVLEKFLGICPFLGVSKQRKQALGMGISLVLVVFLSSMITYFFYTLVLEPLNLECLKILSFILIISTLVQILELVIKRFFKSLYDLFGIYLPLITTNCIVLAATLNVITMSQTGSDFLSLVIYSISLPIGFLVVMYLFSSIRERLEFAPVPKYFKGIAVSLLAATMMAMAFKGFVGMI